MLPPPVDGGLPCPGGLPTSLGTAQARRARWTPWHRRGAACGKASAAGEALLRAEPLAPESSPCDTARPVFACCLCPASSWALGSGFALELKSCLKLQGHEFLWGMSQVRLRRAAGQACTNGACGLGPALPSAAPARRASQGLPQREIGLKECGRVSPSSGEQTSKVVAHGGNPKMSPCLGLTRTGMCLLSQSRR